MRALIEFMRRLEATYTDPQWGRVRTREAELLGINATDWSGLRAMKFDLVMVRDAHRAASTRESVRRADREGEWKLVSAQPGKLRSQPQSFRVGARVQRACDHTTLRQHMAIVVNEARDAGARDPVRAAASMIRHFVRAQPFLGENEHTALVVASVLLRSVGLPGLHAEDVQRDAAFASALVADDVAEMETVVANALWIEALALAEWISPAPSHVRWTLADEHAALTASRTPMELGPIARIASDLLEPLLESREASRRIELTAFADRARAATNATYRGRSICPQHPIFESRWSLSGECDAVLVTALAGQGIAGAASIHLSFEHPSVVQAGPAPALLLPLDEPTADRTARLTAWLRVAVPPLLRGLVPRA